MALAITFIFIQLFFAFLIFFLLIAFISGAPFVPSTGAAAASMIRLAHLKPGMLVIDLGSGDGRLLFSSAKLGARAIGYEINPFLVILTKIRILLHPKRHLLSCRWMNFWRTDIRDADVIFIYLLPWKMESLKRFLYKNAKTGAQIVSNSFIFTDLPRAESDQKHHIYAFEIPEKK